MRPAAAPRPTANRQPPPTAPRVAPARWRQVDDETIDLLKDQFKALDADGSGELDREDVTMLTKACDTLEGIAANANANASAGGGLTAAPSGRVVQMA